MDDGNELYEHESHRGLPRWALVTLIVLGVIALLFVVMMLVGGAGGHGPGRHMGAGWPW